MIACARAAEGDGKIISDMSSEKRLLLFMLLAAVILGSYGLLNQWLAPPSPPAVKQPQAEPREKVEASAKEQPTEKSDVTQPTGTEEKASTAAEAAAVPTTDQTTRGETEEPPTRWITLGSFQGDSPFPLMAIFTTRGAALERLELVERTSRQRLRYRSMDDNQGGYLGYLALRDELPEGCRVNVVPPGTPAASAEPTSPDDPVGLQVGDLLTAIDTTKVTTRYDVAEALRKTRPGQRVELTVQRAGQTLRYTALLAEQPLTLISPESPGQVGPGPNPPSFRCALAAPLAVRAANKDLLEDPGLSRAEWKIAASDERSVTFEWSPPDGQWLFRKRFQIADGSKQIEPAYHIELHFEVVNQSSTARAVAVRWEGPNGLPTEGWWYSTKVHHSFFGVAGARDLIWGISRGQQLRSASEIHRQVTGDSPDRPLFTATTGDATTPLRFVGVDTQYFAVVMSHPQLADGKRLDTSELIPCAWGDVRALPKDRIKLTNVSFYLGMPAQTVAPGEKLTQEFLVFAGPKEPTVLAQYALQDVLYYGWFPWVAKPLSALLHAFYFLVRNYGLAIIMLTVLVRAAMFPLGRKAARNAAVMQELAPELKRIAEKYKNDPQKRLQAQQQLYREHNFNPFGGCLLMLIQLPIFIGLYRCLAVDIHLRQAPLIPGISWCSNLAGPDQLWRWPLPQFLAGETGWLGPYLNVLPIVTIALFLLQQKMFTPPPTDEQQRVQQQMMTFMMIFIGIMFFKVPSGLCIYFIASSLWSVGERMLLPKPGTAQQSAAPKAPPGDVQKRRGLLRRLTKSKRK